VGAATIDELAVADDPDAWAALGFAVEGDACLLGRVCLRFTATGVGRGIAGWSLRGIASTQLDGLPTTLSERAPRAPAGEHPNGALAIDHVVAMSPAFMRSVQALQDAGLDLRRIREQPTPAGAPRQAFFRLGEEILELVQEPEEIVARAGGPERPAHFWGLALVVADLDATVARIAPHAGEPRAAVQPGRRIATVRRSAGLAVPLALMSERERPEAQR
jgi:glyoxalase/bleomycin resistance protein/dioxygenase superfamily protein